MNRVVDSEAKSSLQLLREVFAAGGFGLGIGETLGIRGISADHGHVVLEGAPTSAHHNPNGTVHGGYIATMLDAAMGLSVQTQLETTSRYATANINISYIRAVTPDVATLRSQAKVLHAGRGIVFTEASVVDDAGKLYAHATATFRVTA